MISSPFRLCCEDIMLVVSPHHALQPSLILRAPHMVGSDAGPRMLADVAGRLLPFSRHLLSLTQKAQQRSSQCSLVLRMSWLWSWWTPPVVPPEPTPAQLTDQRVRTKCP